MSTCPARSYPFGARHTIDLEPDYRADTPVTRVALPVGGLAWLITSHELVLRVLSDPAFSRAAANRTHVARLSSELLPAAAILATDPPQHTQLRRLIAGMFAPRRIAALRPVVTAAADLLTEFTTNAAVGDLVSGFVEPFALEVVCELLMVPRPFRRRVSELGDALTARDTTPERLAAARTGFEQLTRDIAADSSGELFEQLGRTAQRDEEIVNLVIALLVGGRGSPTVFISSAVFALLRTPRHYRHLVDHHDAIPAAVEELLRYVPVGVGGGITRVALRDIQLGDVLIRAGDAVIPAMHAASRDPAVFEHPDELILDRHSNSHLAFGHGTHYCVGAALSRLETQVVLDVLTDRLPRLRLTGPADEVVWRTGCVVRALETLEVTW